MKIKALLVPLSGFVVVTPTILAFTSCSNFYTTTLKNMGVDGGEFIKDSNYADLKNSTTSFYNLWLGNKRVNHGNYVIFLSTFGTATISPGASKLIPTSWSITPNIGLNLFNNEFNTILNTTGEKYEASTTLSSLITDKTQPFYQAYNTWQGNGDHDYPIQFFSYFQPYKYFSYQNGAKLDDSVLPSIDFDFPCDVFYKWKDTDYKNQLFNPGYKLGDEKKSYHDQNSWEKKHQIGAYARNDNAAKQYRSLFAMLYKLSPEAFTDKPDGESSLVSIYIKDGKQNSVKKYSNTDTDGTTFASDLAAIYPEHTLS